MNQLIQELADKIWAEEYWTNPNTDKLLPAQLNKFAELLIKECAEVAEDYDGAHYVGTTIKQHFGVKE